MASAGPIILLEDDQDDKDLMEAVLRDLKVENRLEWFTRGDEAMEFLKATAEQPFLIISDLNLPQVKGSEFKKRIDADPELRKKSIPFVFYSTSVNKAEVDEAYNKLTVQGFFKKSTEYEEIKKTVGLMIEYWQRCKHPNSL